MTSLLDARLAFPPLPSGCPSYQGNVECSIVPGGRGNGTPIKDDGGGVNALDLEELDIGREKF